MIKRSNPPSRTRSKMSPALGSSAQAVRRRVKTPAAVPTTKSETLVQLLGRKDGATLAELADAAGWQQHSVRGFISGQLRKKRNLTVLAERVGDGLRYRLAKGG